MRVTGVDLYSAEFEEAISFGLGERNPTSQYQVRTILGLDAEELIPKFYGSGLNTGVKFYDFSLKPRDIVMRVVLNPRFNLGESYSDVRDDLYRTISANRTGMVTLHFRSGATIVSNIVGSIVKFEVAYFNKLPEVQITIRCNNPMFRGINPVLFEDVIEVNPILIPDSLSTAPHGFTMEVEIIDDVGSFIIQDVDGDPEWIFRINPDGGFLIGDFLYLSTEFSEKRAYIVRDPDVIQLVDRIVPGSLWPILFPGQNSFYIPDVEEHIFAIRNVEYYPAYWGV